MLTQSARMRELLLAENALQRPFAGVYSLVLFQRAVICELLATDAADRRLLVL